MAKQGEIRLAQFAMIFGYPRETLRAMDAKNTAPFRPKENAEGQRTYDATDLFAMQVFRDLIDSGGRHEDASRGVLVSGAVSEVFERIEDGRSIADLCLIVPVSIIGTSWGPTLFPFVIEAGRISEIVMHQIGTSQEAPVVYGQPLPKVGFKKLTIVSLKTAFDRAQESAKEAGYVIEGRGIYRSADSLDDDTDANETDAVDERGATE